MAKMVTPPESFSEIPTAVWQGFKEALGIGITGTSQAIEQVPKSIQKPLEVIRGFSLSTIVIGGIALYLLTRRK